MTTSMFKLLSVTNRQLCEEPLLVQVRRIAEGGADAVILREKELPESAYRALAKEFLEICRENGTIGILHTFVETAEALGAEALHVPLPVLRELPETQRKKLRILGASCHSLGDVQEAAALGCTYVTLGHIFATDCKKGVPPRGLELLEEVCTKSPVPVYAIGGIGEGNLSAVQAAGASGACIMSGLMTCPDPEAYLKRLRAQVKAD